MTRIQHYAHSLLIAGLAACCFLTYPNTAAALAGPAVVDLNGVLNSKTDDTPAFTPDGNTVFFDRSVGRNKTIMVSHRSTDGWGSPQVAPFSGNWLDQDPAVSPDGSFLIISSNRPVAAGGEPIVFEEGGKPYRGANLWRVDRRGADWGEPLWLGAAVNTATLVVAPSVVADGSVYFIQRMRGAMHIFRSQYRNGRYLPGVLLTLGDPAISTHDPAVAPDESFMVFDYGKPGRLCISFSNGARWSKPEDLGNTVNRDGPWGARLSADHRTVYFTGSTRIWSLSLASWLPATDRAP